MGAFVFHFEKQNLKTFFSLLLLQYVARLTCLQILEFQKRTLLLILRISAFLYIFQKLIFEDFFKNIFVLSVSLKKQRLVTKLLHWLDDN